MALLHALLLTPCAHAQEPEEAYDRIAGLCRTLFNVSADC
jgi:hypothetical protein